MKVTISKSQWEEMGKKSGWTKVAQPVPQAQPQAQPQQASQPMATPAITSIIDAITSGSESIEKEAQALANNPQLKHTISALYGQLQYVMTILQKYNQ